MRNEVALSQADFLRLAVGLLDERAAHRERTRHSFDWRRVARPKQLPPGSPGADSQRTDWRYWLLMSGRGFGKTRTGAEAVREQVREGRRRYIAFVAPTLDDGRKIMIEGPSGILTVSPPDERPRWIRDKRELHWPNGAIGYLYTSEEPERLRGPEHDYAWCEELGAWRRAEATWSNLRFGMRRRGPRGDSPVYVLTTTPRPTPLMRKLVADPKTELVGGTTYENRANLDEEFVSSVLTEYEGTRLGDQELLGKLLGDTPGALWKPSLIESMRIDEAPETIQRIVVAIDPAVADAEERRRAEAEQRYLGETGIVVVGRARCLCRDREEQHGFVFEDLSGYFQPEEWASLAVEAYHRRKADRIIAEVNNGGKLVETTIRALGDRHVSYKPVNASRGKQARAEPIAALYERRMIHHVGVHTKLEDQMTTWNPLLSRKSPDRMDALVWGLTEVMLGARSPSSAPSTAGSRRM